MLTATNTVSAREIQRHYKSIFDKVKVSGEPVVVIANNKPQVVILDIVLFEELAKASRVSLSKLHENLVYKLQKQAKKQRLTQEILLEELKQSRKEVFKARYGKARKD